jgi:surfeit locus 1 family protein
VSSRREPAVVPGTDGHGRDERHANGWRGAPPRRSPWLEALIVALAAFFFVLFVALGTWQVKRRAWKLDLIARVEQRVHAPALPAPGPAQWPHVTAATDEYRHVTATGTFLDSSQTLVQAVTDLGAGYWVLTPLQEADGSVVLVNRGFVAADDRGRVAPGAAGTRVVDGSTASVASTGGDSSPAAATSTRGDGGPSASTATVTGLLRITEPGGGFLRSNNPGANLWYSRDVQAIAGARGLSHVAPYFIDAEASTANPIVAHAAGATVVPTPGLTVIHFHNSHLVYAITWYTLALMTAIAICLGMRKQ